MNGQEDGPFQRRRRNPGRTSRNFGIAAVSIAAAGYILGLLIAWALNSSRTSTGVGGRFVFMPIGGIAALVTAIVAIQAGTRTRRFIKDLGSVRRERLGFFMDVEKESRLASVGIALGVISIVINPLIGFFIIAVLR
jgi:hypothetical protein